MKLVSFLSLMFVCLSVFAVLPAVRCFAEVKDSVATIQDSATIAVNLNSASKDELIQVTGLGPTLADRIIAYRSEYGPFESLEDVMSVKGIGEAKFKKIQSMITV
ncbi:MAG: helix-hairpin-helix domain-containing protein [Candidatus Omnitrophica bacterium]|nr:helix-hairpin-helix domain-containing protein [Candidatus Omnitrophota bacterium]